MSWTSLAAGLPLLERHVAGDALDPDRELVERFRDGERAAFDQLVRRHQKGMWRLVRRYVKQRRRRRRRHPAGVRARVSRARCVSRRRDACAAGCIGSRSTARCRGSAITAASSRPRSPRTRSAEPAPAPAQIERRRDQRAAARARSRSCRRSRSWCSSSACSTTCRSRRSPSSPTARENTAKVNFHYAVKRLRDILGARA